jgi:copper(I)-binding protein
MLIGPHEPVQDGERRRLTLRFAGGIEIAVELPVRQRPETES